MQVAPSSAQLLGIDTSFTVPGPTAMVKGAPLLDEALLLALGVSVKLPSNVSVLKLNVSLLPWTVFWTKRVGSLESSKVQVTSSPARRATDTPLVTEVNACDVPPTVFTHVR